MLGRGVQRLTHLSPGPYHVGEGKALINQRQAGVWGGSRYYGPVLLLQTNQTGRAHDLDHYMRSREDTHGVSLQYSAENTLELQAGHRSTVRKVRESRSCLRVHI